MYRRHNILLTPYKHDSAQCGVMKMSVWYAYRINGRTCKVTLNSQIINKALKIFQPYRSEFLHNLSVQKSNIDIFLSIFFNKLVL
jgi:hypothetical protein